MSATVEDLLKANAECVAAREEVASVSELYPIEGVPFETGLYEIALRRRKKANDAMKALVKLATPEVLAEAQARSRRP